MALLIGLRFLVTDHLLPDQRHFLGEIRQSFPFRNDEIALAGFQRLDERFGLTREFAIEKRNAVRVGLAEEEANRTTGGRC